MKEWMNEWKRLLTEIKNIKLNTNNNVKQYIYQRCYQITKNIYGNPKSLNLSLINLAYRYKSIEKTRLQQIFKTCKIRSICNINGSKRLKAIENWRALLSHIGLTSL